MSENIKVHFTKTATIRKVFLQCMKSGIWKEVKSFEQTHITYYDYDDLQTYTGLFWVKVKEPKFKHKFIPAIEEISEQARIVAEELYGSGKGNVKITCIENTEYEICPYSVDYDSRKCTKCIWYNGSWVESIIQRNNVYIRSTPDDIPF